MFSPKMQNSTKCTKRPHTPPYSAICLHLTTNHNIKYKHYTHKVLSTLPMSYEGVSYLPTQDAFQSPVSVNDLEWHGIRYVRIQWVDLVNSIRCRIVPLAYFKKLLRLSRPGFSIPKVALGLVFLTVAEGFRHVFDNTNSNVHTDDNISSPVGEWLYAFDLSSIRLCPYAPGHASIMGWFEAKTPTRLAPAIEVDICPRTILRRVLEYVS